MGCDIHGWIERKTSSGWVAVNELKDKGRSRNYERFAKLAGVRGDGPEPRGMPCDVSATAKYHIEQWDTDGHSHSWLPIAEAAPIFLATAWQPEDFEKKYPLSSFFDLEIGDIPSQGTVDEYRLVFWFDN